MVKKVSSLYAKSKDLVSDLGIMSVVCIDVCVSGCMIYYKEDEHLSKCRICGERRYHMATRGKKSSGYELNARKSMLYPPIILRLEHLFLCPITIEKTCVGTPLVLVLQTVWLSIIVMVDCGSISTIVIMNLSQNHKMLGLDYIQTVSPLLICQSVVLHMAHDGHSLQSPFVDVYEDTLLVVNNFDARPFEPQTKDRYINASFIRWHAHPLELWCRCIW